MIFLESEFLEIGDERDLCVETKVDEGALNPRADVAVETARRRVAEALNFI